MPVRTVRINGTVTDIKTQKPVGGVRVDVMSAVQGKPVTLGKGKTDGNGRFEIPADVDIKPGPAGTATGVVPATLAMSLNGKALKTKGDIKIPNLLAFERDAVIQVAVPAAAPPLPAPPPDQPPAGGPTTGDPGTGNQGSVDQGQDRITVPQILTGINFVHQSDFSGVFREGRDRVSSVGSLVFDSLKSAVKSVKVSPLKPSEVHNNDVINQDQQTATNRLGQKGIQVGSVLAYQPGSNLGSIKSVASTIKPGDTVDLYEENGVVKAYQIRKPVTPVADNTQLVGEVTNLQKDVRTLQQKNQEIDQVKAAQDSNSATLAELQRKAAAVDQLEAELAQMKKQSVQKDQLITQLQSDMANVRNAHAALEARISPDRLTALEERVRKLQITKRRG